MQERAREVRDRTRTPHAHRREERGGQAHVSRSQELRSPARGRRNRVEGLSWATEAGGNQNQVIGWARLG